MRSRPGHPPRSRPAGVALAALVVFLAAPGCRKEPPAPSDRLRIVFAVAPETLDPQRHQEDATRSVLANFYEGLVETDETLQVRPVLATTWSNPDERTWRFQLRRAVTFHDGSPLGPEDVIRTVARARTARGSRADADVRSIVEARKVDATTVELVTDRPRPLLLAKLAQLPILPRTVPDAEITRPVGTGPYRFVDPPGAGTSGEVRGVRWERYWGVPPPFASFVVEVARNEQALAAAARGGAAVVVPLPAAAFAEGLRPGSPFRSVRSPTLTASFLVCRIAPLAGGVPSPFRDVRVRRAVDLALERERLVATVLPGEARPAFQLAVRGVHGHDAELPPRPHDLDAARRLLAEAGFGRGLDSVLLVSSRGRDVGAEIARQLGRAGIRLKVEAVEWPEMLPRMAGGRAPLALASWTYSTGDVSGLLEPVLHGRGGPEGFGSESTTGYADPEVDAAIELAARTMEPSVRAQLLTRVARKAVEDLPLVPLFGLDFSYGVRRDLAFTPRLDLCVRARDVRPAAARR